MLLLTYVSSYIKNGQTRFTYSVSSNEKDSAKATAELAEYKAIKGTYYREDEKKNPLYFTDQVIADNTQIQKKSNGKDYYILTDLKEKQQYIDEVAETMQGKLEGMRRYSGMSRKSFMEVAMRSAF